MCTKVYKGTIANQLDCLKEDELKNGFIGKDGKHHEYEYDKKQYKYRTHMTNEEFYSINDQRALENCQKCPMWPKCKVAEHTVTTMKCVVDKGADELAKEINKQILESIL